MVCPTANDAAPAGDSRLMEGSPQHTVLTLTLTWLETGGEKKRSEV